jgi:hypothetical protein
VAESEILRSPGPRSSRRLNNMGRVLDPVQQLVLLICRYVLSLSDMLLVVSSLRAVSNRWSVLVFVDDAE